MVGLLAGVVLLLAYSVDVCGVDLVPRSHVLLHARCHAGLLAAGQRAAWFGDALLEAVLLKFLETSQVSQCMLADEEQGRVSRAATLFRIPQ